MNAEGSSTEPVALATRLAARIPERTVGVRPGGLPAMAVAFPELAVAFRAQCASLVDKWEFISGVADPEALNHAEIS